MSANPAQTAAAEQTALSGLARALVQNQVLRPDQAVAIQRRADAAGLRFIDQAIGEGALGALQIASFCAETFGHPLLDLLGVRYLLATERLVHGGPEAGPVFEGPGGRFHVHERAGALPRAFTVGQLRILADDEAVLTQMTDRGFRPADEALCTAADASGIDAVPVATSRRPVRFVTDHGGTVELAVAAGEPCWLVLADTLLPGWSATVDGIEQRIVRVNHSMRAVLLPAGAASVRFTYAAPGLLTGAVASLLGLALIVCLGAVALRRSSQSGT